MKVNAFIKCYNCLKDLNSYVKKENIKNFGLEKETNELIKNLYKYKKKNVLIIGKPGIGKTALVENLACLINNKEVPEFLQNKIIIELSLGAAVGGTKYRGEFEEKIESILDYVKNHQNIILFIDEVHNILNAGGAEGAIKAGDLFKPYLARNDISVIGATTMEEYQKSIKTDKALNRRFSVIKMKEPNIKKTINILTSTKNVYEEHYNIELSESEIVGIVYTSKHLKGNYPDKAFDRLEDYCYQKKQIIEHNLI